MLQQAKEPRATIQGECFTTAATRQCEHKCLRAVGPSRSAEGIVERHWAVRDKRDKEMLLLERTRCVKFPESVTAESI